MSTVASFVLSLMLLAPAVLATAAAQFKLDVNRDASNCFVVCAKRLEETVNIDGGTEFQWIGENCRSEQWREQMATCLPLTCTSAPDVAYGMEYGYNFCRRAGVKGFEFVLSQDYLNGTDGEYFRSKEYLDSSTQPSIVPYILAVGAGFATTVVLQTL
ncbi:hypothetical protein IAU60_002907 [Kwoniella sp. DSM 27419]